MKRLRVFLPPPPPGWDTSPSQVTSRHLIHSDEGLTLETTVFESFTVANLLLLVVDNLFQSIKKWSIVVDQISLHKSKQKPLVVCCAQGIIPRLGEDEFQIISKLSGCQISGTSGEGFGKLHIKVLCAESVGK